MKIDVITAFEDLIKQDDGVLLLDYSNKLRNINDRIYHLLYLKITKKSIGVSE